MRLIGLPRGLPSLASGFSHLNNFVLGNLNFHYRQLRSESILCDRLAIS